MNTDKNPSAGEDHTTRVQQLFIKNASFLKGYILSLLPDFAEAEDVFQEVFLVVTRKAESFEEGTNFLAWACTISRYKVMESNRKWKSSPQAMSDEVLESLCATAPEPLHFDERIDAVKACIENLAPNARKVIEMRYRQEHKPAEIARRLSWEPESVYVALSRARSVLRECVNRKMSQHGLKA